MSLYRSAFCFCCELDSRLKLQARNVKMGMRVAALGFPLGTADASSSAVQTVAVEMLNREPVAQAQ